MPYATQPPMELKPKAIPQVRQKLFKVLEQAIPQVRTEGVRQMVLANPVLWPANDKQFTPHSGKPLSETKEGRTHQVYLHRWYEQRLEASRSPCLLYVMEGEADMRIGITERMLTEARGLSAKSYLRECDFVTVSLSKGAFVLLPTGIPHSDGSKGHWDRPHSERAHSRILWLRTLPMGAFCHTCCSHNENHDSDPPLFVQDTKLNPALEFLIEEMTERAADSEAVAQCQLLTMLLRIKRALAKQTGIEDATESLEQLSANGATLVSHSNKATIVSRACSFIESNLHAPLDLNKIAAHVFVSPTQLNRIFQAELQQSVMKYVTQRRLELAKVLLSRSGLPISEIGKLAGCTSASYFSQMFLRCTGLTPAEYRKLPADVSNDI
jgi:AraC-like DNA-binding protein